MARQGGGLTRNSRDLAWSLAGQSNGSSYDGKANLGILGMALYWVLKPRYDFC